MVSFSNSTSYPPPESKSDEKEWTKNPAVIMKTDSIFKSIDRSLFIHEREDW